MCDVSARVCSCAYTENAVRANKKESCPGGGGWRDFHFLLHTVVLLFSIRACLFYKEKKINMFYVTREMVLRYPSQVRSW